ncbi:MAG TPA: fasciclin domain-containing protein [Thermoleophilaceae bacterium]|nr:fasciclin domain-containing protein [Thermoleophilaceae bacterium]
MRTVRIALILAAVTAVSVTGAASASAQQAGAAQDADIVDTAVAAGSFDTLAKLLERARLVDTLKSEGPFTVFAPTDAAFAKVPKNKLNALLRNRRKLRRVLLYHVAAGQLEAADVVQRWSIRTLNGRKVRVRVRDSNVFLNRARVVTPDVMASNGVIHVIDRVLIPPAG